MFKELESAHHNVNDDVVLKQQVSRIKLLCELILEQDAKTHHVEQMRQVELSKMTKSTEKVKKIKEKSVEADTDPYSIFDF